MMGLGNIDSDKTRERLAQHGRGYDEPEAPKLPDLAANGPAFVVTEGDAKSEAMDTLEQIHDLYRKEGVRLADAYVAREKAYAERKAYLLANPTKPKDVTVRFWERSKPSPAGIQALEGEEAQ